MDVDVKKLEKLSLTSKVCSELETNLGPQHGDKILAEFITDLGRNSKSVEEFNAKLKENGAAEIPDYLVRNLLTIIHAVLAPEKNQRSSKRDDDKTSLKDRSRESRGSKGEEDKPRDRRRKSRGNEDQAYNSGEPELYVVYKGVVTRVMDTGCFVELSSLRGKEGLVHVSQMEKRRVSNAKDVVKRGHQVYVKVVSISGHKLSLSMKDVDQKTGKDLLPITRSSGYDTGNSDPLMSRDGTASRTSLSGIRIKEDSLVQSCRLRKRLSSPERWEIKQLIASGVSNAKDYAEIYQDEEVARIMMVYKDEGPEEELEIELNEEALAFLQGHDMYSVDMSPVKIFKNPEGSLSRAAALQSALVKERREMRDQQQRAVLDSIPKDLNCPWEDPMPEIGERHLAQEIRGVGLSAHDVPEWKKEAYGKAISFGNRSRNKGRACLSTS
ncbi:hypothetical protein ACLB2K_030541 [Fragaria x ananassa]